jgi:hypothetical protein
MSQQNKPRFLVLIFIAFISFYSSCLADHNNKIFGLWRLDQKVKNGFVFKFVKINANGSYFESGIVSWIGSDQLITYEISGTFELNGEDINFKINKSNQEWAGSIGEVQSVKMISLSTTEMVVRYKSGREDKALKIE